MLQSIHELLRLNQQHHQELQTICKPLEQFFGMQQFTYYQVNDDGETIVVNSHQPHFEYYMEKQQYRYDPHIVCPDNMKAGYAFWSGCEDNDYQGQMIHLTRTIFSIDHGISYIEKNDHSYCAYTFGVQANKSNHIYNLYFNYLAFIEYFIDFFNVRATQLLQTAKTCSVNMSALKGPCFANQPGITTTNLNAHERKQLLTLLN